MPLGTLMSVPNVNAVPLILSACLVEKPNNKQLNADIPKAIPLAWLKISSRYEDQLHGVVKKTLI